MKKCLWTACFLLSLALLTTACEKSDNGAKAMNLPLLREKVGGDALDTIKEAGLVELEEIEPSKEKGYAYTGFGKALTQRQAEQLKRLLLSDDNFEFNRMKSCLFVPKSALHFKAKNQSTVTILYSPWCKQIKVIRQDQEAILEADAISDSIDRILRLSEEERK